jgi:para-nitrobenzyl esterase
MTVVFVLLAGCGSEPPSEVRAVTPADETLDAAMATDGAGGNDAVDDASVSGVDANVSSDGSATVDARSGCQSGSPVEGPLVRSVGEGILTGSEPVAGVVQFLGVPYAAPPVGPLRWQLPAPAPCYEEAGLQAITWPPLCPQLNEDKVAVGDEDCLHLNIWAPENAEDAPVLFFLPGGGNVQGGVSVELSPGNYLYDGALWAQEQQAVVVTANYRIGALGFLLAGTEQGLDEAIDGNFGLHDQIAALQWVQANIEAFGGDPERVVLFGESAGAGNTCRLLTSPFASGLFDAAIMQSGGPCSTALESAVREEGATFVASVNDLCAGSVDCLRELDAMLIVERADAAPSLGADGTAFQPWVDGTLLTAQPAHLLQTGVRNVDRMIVGANSEETSRTIPLSLTEAQFNALLTATAGRLAPQVRNLYPLSDFDSPWEAWVRLTSDYRFICSAEMAAGAMTDGGGQAFLYHFAASTSGATERFGAWHGLELVYLFGNFGIPGYVPADAEVQLGRDMRTLWTSFAGDAANESGQPVAEGLEWAPFDDARSTLLLDTSPRRLVDGVRAEYCAFWTPILRTLIAD